MSGDPSPDSVRIALEARSPALWDGHAGPRIAAAWSPRMGWQPDLADDNHLAYSPEIAGVIFTTESI